VGITPIGYAKSGKTHRSGFFSKLLRSHNRKSLETLILNNEYDLPSWMTTALKAAQKAPSVINRQPWRFTVDSNSITVSIDNPRMGQRFPKVLDCGIAMLHLELGARKEGVNGIWDFLESPDVARYVI
jgi:hypothetical protein